MSTRQNWYIKNAGQIFGPYTMQQIKQFIEEKKLLQEHLISDDKMNWLSLPDFLNVCSGHTQQPETLNLQPPQKKMIGKYEVLSEIGRGGMGVVYHARDPHLNRECAIKVILGANDENARKRFLAEANAIAQLDHPNVISILEMGNFRDEYGTNISYFAMDYVDGKSLNNLMVEQKLSLIEKLQIFLQICRGVEHAHRKNVIHRDLKPANIVVTSKNVPVILDFGLARKIDVSTEITKTGEIFGTPQYMAPENIKGQKIADKKSDVYSLGAILYKLLTDRVPFDGEDILEILFQVTTKLPLPPSSLNVSIKKNSDLEVICLKTLEKTPSKRTLSAKFLGDEIERFLSNKPILTKTPKPWDILAKKLRHDRPFLVSLLIIILIVSFSASFSIYVIYQNKILEQKNDEITKQSTQRQHEKLQKVMVIINTGIENNDFSNVLKEIKETNADFEELVNGKNNTKKESKDIYLPKLKNLQMLLKFSILPNLPEVKKYHQIIRSNTNIASTYSIENNENNSIVINGISNEEDNEKHVIISSGDSAVIYQKKDTTECIVLSPQKDKSQTNLLVANVPNLGIPFLLSPNGKYLILRNSSRIYIYDILQDLELFAKEKFAIGNTTQVAFSPNSNYLAFKDLEKSLVVLDLGNNKKIYFSKKEDSFLKIGSGNIVFSANNRYIAFFLSEEEKNRDISNNTKNISIIDIYSGTRKSKEFTTPHEEKSSLLIGDKEKNIFYCNTNFDIKEYEIKETQNDFFIEEKSFRTLGQQSLTFSLGTACNEFLSFGAGREIFLMRKTFQDEIENYYSYKIKNLSVGRQLDFCSFRTLMYLDENKNLHFIDTSSEKFIYNQPNIHSACITNEQEILLISEVTKGKKEKVYSYQNLHLEPSLVTKLYLSEASYDLYKKASPIFKKEKIFSATPTITHIQDKMFVISIIASRYGFVAWEKQKDSTYKEKICISILSDKAILLPKIIKVSLDYDQKYLCILISARGKNPYLVFIDLENTNLVDIDNVFNFPDFDFPDKNFKPNIKNIVFSKTKKVLYFNSFDQLKMQNTTYGYSLENQKVTNLLEVQEEIIEMKASKNGFIAILQRNVDVTIFDENSKEVQTFSWRRNGEKIEHVVRNIAVSHFDKTVALANQIGQIRIWQQNANSVWENYLEGDLDIAQEINNLSFSPDGRYLAIFTFDDIFIYDLQLKLLVRSYIGYYKGGGANFSEDWRYAILPTEDAQFVVFDQSYFVDEDAFSKKITSEGNEIYFIEKDNAGNISYWPLRMNKSLLNFNNK